MSILVLVASETSRERRYLADGRRGRGLGTCGRVRLVHRGGLLAACLPAIVVVSETDKVKEVCQ